MMNVPEGYRPRKGDVVLVAAQVAMDYDVDDAHVHLKVEYARVGIELENIVGIQSLKFDEGDKVRRRINHEDLGEIVALCDGCAWVKSADGGFTTFSTIELEPAPQEPDPIPEAAPEPPLADDAPVEEFDDGTPKF